MKKIILSAAVALSAAAVNMLPINEALAQRGSGHDTRATSRSSGSGSSARSSSSSSFRSSSPSSSRGTIRSSTGSTGRPSVGVRPGTSSRPSASVRPSTTLRPGTTTRPSFSTRPGSTVRPGGRSPGISTRPSGLRPGVTVRPSGSRTGASIRPAVRRPGAGIAARPIGRRPGVSVRPIARRPGAVARVRDARFSRTRPLRIARNVNFVQNYNVRFGRRAAWGWWYPGSTHRHWTRCIWNVSLGCYTYYCPNTFVYYYWCAPHNCFYPTTYCPTGVYDYGFTGVAADELMPEMPAEEFDPAMEQGLEEVGYEETAAVDAAPILLNNLSGQAVAFEYLDGQAWQGAQIEAGDSVELNAAQALSVRYVATGELKQFDLRPGSTYNFKSDSLGSVNLFAQ